MEYLASTLNNLIHQTAFFNHQTVNFRRAHSLADIFRHIIQHRNIYKAAFPDSRNLFRSLNHAVIRDDMSLQGE